MKIPPNDPVDYLRQLGETSEGPYNIALAALILGSLDHSNRALEPYHSHLQEMAEQARLESRLAVNADDGARSLAELLAGRYGYDGDRLAYDDPQNANLISVIERRRGMPVALGILYIHAARAAGFEASGLNSPGHFLLRIELRGSETLIDPFNGGTALERERFRAPPKMRGVGAEEEQALRSVTDAEVLLRLQNNLKLRALQQGNGAHAIEIAQRMVLVAPKRPELWMDLAHLNEDEGALSAARKAYETCLTLTKSGTAFHNEAALGLRGLKRRLN
jgi:regulator of sirC expression with transglutaminase-like and TPR domain